jgi:hypothetical protein
LKAVYVKYVRGTSKRHQMFPKENNLLEMKLAGDELRLENLN